MKNKAEIVKIIKFCFIGALNTAIDWGISSICFVLLKLAETISNGIGYTIGGLFSYTVNRKWTFKTKGKFFSMEIIYLV